MSVNNWFRKNNKKLLVGIGIFLMIGFLLPNVGRLGGQRPENQPMARIVINGQTEDITIRDRQMAERDLQILRALRVPMMYQQSQAGVYPVLSLMPDRMGWIDPVVVLATNALILGDEFMGDQIQNMLYQAIAAQADTAAEQRRLMADIDAITEVMPVRAPDLYHLLLREAKAVGIAATPEQVESLLEARGQLIAAGQLDHIPMGVIINEVAGSQDNVKGAVANYLALIRAVQTLTQTGLLSEPQIRHAVRDELAIMNVTGDFVTFRAETFEKGVQPPTEEEIQAHFAAYKDNEPGATNTDNPHGFGYRLPDRVRIEYLRVSLDDVKAEVTERFNALSAAEREAAVRQFWSDNLQLFREQTLTEDDARDSSSFRDPPYDEVAHRARELYLQRQAREQAETLLAEARQQIRARTAETGNPREANLEAIAAAVGAGAVPVRYGRTEYLSPTAASEYEDFWMTYLMRGGRPEKPLLDLMFNSKPLQSEDADEGRRPDPDTLDLYETVGPLATFNQRYEVTGMMLARITGADAARIPTSLNDDGRQGSADADPFPGQSRLRRRVTEDLERLQAYNAAEVMARRFAEEAVADWDEALAAVNETLGDPNETLFTNSLAEVRSLMDQWRQNLREEDLDRPELQRMLARMAANLRLAAKRTVELDDESAGIQVIPDPQWGRWLVVRNLWAMPPNEQQYATRRAFQAQRMKSQAQAPLVLAHLNPSAIEARWGYQPIRDFEPVMPAETP